MIQSSKIKVKMEGLFIYLFMNSLRIKLKLLTTAHPWCSGHSTNINACGVWGVRAGVQVFRREFHTHIHLD